MFLRNRKNYPIRSEYDIVKYNTNHKSPKLKYTVISEGLLFKKYIYKGCINKDDKRHGKGTLLRY